jgi:hypothetical protein
MNNQQTEKTSQNLENLSFDKSFDISVRLLKGYNSDTNSLVTIATDATGKVKLDPTGLDTRFLKLDQTTPQHVTVNAPIFDEGITVKAGSRITFDG